MLDPQVFPSEPPSLHIRDYFCQQCGGLTRLPDQLLLAPYKLKWCICSWHELQKTFAGAMDFYLNQEERHHHDSNDSHDEEEEEEEKALWTVVEPQSRGRGRETT